MGEGSDPIAQLHAAHETAAVLLRVGRAALDPTITQRLLELVDEIGLSTLADLWSGRPARTLPGALWRLYFIREWMRTDSTGVGRVVAARGRLTLPNHVVGGIAPPPPDHERRSADAAVGEHRGVGGGTPPPTRGVPETPPPPPLAGGRPPDDILRGAFEGDFAVALERAAAFCAVASAGSADLDGHEALLRATRLQQMAADLAASARLWRAGSLS